MYSLVEQEYAQLCYQTLPEGTLEDLAMRHPTACSMVNYRFKNRYKNVLPVEETRVKLESDSMRDRSDYINANFVEYKGKLGNRTNYRYICTQAPLPSTFCDFWWMVWQQKSPVICVLNRLQEAGKIKGDIYWPCQTGETKPYGDVHVTLDWVFPLPKFDIEIRRFKLESCTSKRKLFQICYEGWPDFGVPSSSVAIRELIHLVRFYRQWGVSKSLDGPCVVHCSAGIGRCGTFLGTIIAFETTFQLKNPSDLPNEDIELSEESSSGQPPSQQQTHQQQIPPQQQSPPHGTHQHCFEAKHHPQQGVKQRYTLKQKSLHHSANKDHKRGYKPKLDNIVNQFEIFDIVLSLRQQRNRGTVQTVKQYEFIYQTLKDELDSPLLISSAIQHVHEWQRTLRNAKFQTITNLGKPPAKSRKRTNSNNDLPPAKRSSCEGTETNHVRLGEELKRFSENGFVNDIGTETKQESNNSNFLVHGSLVLEDQFKENLCLDVCC